MFTGIIDGIGKIIFVKNHDFCLVFTLKMPLLLLKNLLLGGSVAINGCCLSVTNIQDDYVSFDVIQETLKITNFGSLKVGDYVNIERSKKFSDEIGGHYVSGHISTIATCVNLLLVTHNIRTISYQLKNICFMKYIFSKGFIVVNGVSFTIGDVFVDSFNVHVIPDTLSRTIIKYLNIGDNVNIEIDCFTNIIVDTTEKFLQHRS
ncbi:MAG: riboflavin synthase subunit alpha [Buchnera aphidicola (Eriosoma harunire)]